MAHHERQPLDIHGEIRRADPLLSKVLVYGGVIGLVILAVTFAANYWLAKDGLQHFAYSYLTSFSFFLSLSLGGLCFVLIHYATRSGWGVAVRRIGEVFGANFPVLALLALPVLAMSRILFPWTGPEATELAHLPGIKGAYLTLPFLYIRCAIYFAVWIWMGFRLLRASTRQDASGDPSVTTRLEKFSAGGLVLYAFTITFFAIDFLMSLAPKWYSTIFGAYYFSGAMVGFLALFAIVCLALQREGVLRHAITSEHYHDIGKLLFAFIMFWAYIAYSQYMLIWYANIPEETAWFAPRQAGQWGWIGLMLVGFHFLLPFVFLMPRTSKRRRGVLLFWCVWMLVMHYLDLYWVIMPRISPGVAPLSLTDLGCFLGIGGIFLAGAAATARGRSLIPERDPRLPESLAFENM